MLITPYILELEPSWHHICHRKTITLNFPHKKFVFLSKDPKTRKPLVYFRSPNLHSFRFKKNEKLRVTPNIIELEPFWHHFWTFRFFQLFDQKIRFLGKKQISKQTITAVWIWWSIVKKKSSRDILNTNKLKTLALLIEEVF